MTEKRFKLAYDDYEWWAICDKENPTKLGISGQEVVDLMNKLNNENKQLKSDNKNCAKSYMKLFDKYIKLQKRNNKENKCKIPYLQRIEDIDD